MRSLILVLVGLLIVAPIVKAQGTWERVPKLGEYCYINGMAPVNSQLGYAVGGVTVYATENGGQAWSIRYMFDWTQIGQLTGVWADTGVIVVSATAAYSNQPGPIYRSTDFGRTFVKVGSSIVFHTEGTFDLPNMSE